MKTTAYAWVHTEDVSAKFTATMVESDYGVPGSPTFWEPEGIEIDYVEPFWVDHFEVDGVFGSHSFYTCEGFC